MILNQFISKQTITFIGDSYKGKLTFKKHANNNSLLHWQSSFFLNPRLIR